MIAATFHGASYSPPNYDFDTIAVFPSLEEAIDALFERYTSNGRRHISTAYLDGHTEDVLWPTVEIGDSFTCYRMPEVEEDDPTISATEMVEGQQLAVHTAVHGGWWDYKLTLITDGDDDDIAVKVVRA